jgi:hypothetical protein
MSMKKLVFSLVTSVLMLTVFGQSSDKFTRAMEVLVPAVDTSRSAEGLTELANSFERIANAEKTQWLPYYYAALCYINKANMLYTANQLDQIDPLMDKAEPLLNKAGELEKNNADILCLKKMFNTGKMMADPMNRFMTFGAAATEALEAAKSIDPENPRIYLLEGIDKYYTPEQWGGSKTEAKKLFEEAKKKFETSKPASSIHPSWGLSQVKYFLTQQ